MSAFISDSLSLSVNAAYWICAPGLEAGKEKSMTDTVSLMFLYIGDNILCSRFSLVIYLVL